MFPMMTLGAVLAHKHGINDEKKTYWLGPLGGFDDFGDAYKDIMYDAKTNMGPWANMTEASYKKYGLGRLGLGWGQKYKKQADGRWLKIEG